MDRQQHQGKEERHMKEQTAAQTGETASGGHPAARRAEGENAPDRRQAGAAELSGQEAAQSLAAREEALKEKEQAVAREMARLRLLSRQAEAKQAIKDWGLPPCAMDLVRLDSDEAMRQSMENVLALARAVQGVAGEPELAQDTPSAGPMDYRERMLRYVAAHGL